MSPMMIKIELVSRVRKRSNNGLVFEDQVGDILNDIYKYIFGNL